MEPEPGPEAQRRATWGTSIWAGSSLVGGGPDALERSGRVPRAGAARWRGEERRGRLGQAARPGAAGRGAGGGPSPGISGDHVTALAEGEQSGTPGPAADWARGPLLQQSAGLAAPSLPTLTPCGGAASRPLAAVMVGQPQPRGVDGSPRPRVIVGTIRPRVIVGSTRARPPADGTSRPHLAAEESPRPRVVVGTPRARVIVGSPRPRMIVSSPWPAVVVASPRPRAPVGSPWPRVIVGTPRSRVIVGSPRARVAGADQVPAPSRGSPQSRRRDEHSGSGAEGPRPGGAAPGRRQGHVGLLAAMGCGRGGGGTSSVRGLDPALRPSEVCCFWVVPYPRPGQPGCGTWARSG